VQRFDPSRNIVEHHVDGDLVNGETPINRTKAAPDSLHVWGTSQGVHLIFGGSELADPIE